MNDIAAQVARNLAEVKSRIAEAAARSGRADDDVRLVAVTKYVDEPAVRAIVAAGCHDLGESRPKDLWTRAANIVDREVRWHFIGHMQRNKLRRTLPLVHLLQSVDSERLLAAVEEESAAAGLVMPSFLEVNISGDPAKHGFRPEEARSALETAMKFSHISIHGLMGMASLEGGVDAARRNFAALRELRDELAAEFGSAVDLGELSMGMSGDYEAAIEEGATIVRVGSALFEGLDP